MEKKILMIDDDQDLTRSFQVLLESQNYTVYIANDGQAGMQRLRNERPDLLILDVMMGTNLEGYDLLHLIKKEPALIHIPIILLTGMIDAMGVNLISAVEDEEMFPNVVFRDKPIEPSELLELVAKMMK
jgi:two-component system, OmpR family, alkaline phosphatase synthesis response regulator PhoP